MQPAQQAQPGAPVGQNAALGGRPPPNANQWEVPIKTSDGTQTFTMTVVFKPGMTPQQRDAKIATYSDPALQKRIADVAQGMKLGKPKGEGDAQKKLTSIRFTTNTEGKAQITKTYQNATDTSQKVHDSDYYNTKAKAKGGPALPFYATRKEVLSQLEQINKKPQADVINIEAGGKPPAKPREPAALPSEKPAAAAAPQREAGAAKPPADEAAALPQKVEPGEEAAKPWRAVPLSRKPADAAPPLGQAAAARAKPAAKPPAAEAAASPQEVKPKEAVKVWKPPVMDGVGKTKVDDLEHGCINPFKIDFKEGGRMRTPSEQAQEMYAYFEEVFKKDPDAKIAITYSANLEQAGNIYRFYENYKGKPLPPQMIRGSNQAKVFNELLQLMKKEECGWGGKVHILPVPTMQYDKNRDKKGVEKSDVEIAMDNIQAHVNEKWIVLGLQNQSSKQGQLAIGGGVADSVDKDGKELWNETKGKEVADREMKRLLDQPGKPAFERA